MIVRLRTLMRLHPDRWYAALDVGVLVNNGACIDLPDGFVPDTPELRCSQSLPAPTRRRSCLFRLVRRLARDGDRGLGDIVARALAVVGGDAFKRTFKRIAGRPCGCESRQEALNRAFPFKP
jgi:hypothetical protein